MNCEHAKELCRARCDGETTDVEESQLNSHLDSCSDCRRYDLQMKVMISSLDRLREASERVFVDIADRSSAPCVARRPRLWMPRYVGGLAAVLLLAVSVGVYRNKFEHSSRDQCPVSVMSDSSFDSLQSVAEPAMVDLRLIGKSNEEYISVPQESSQNGVHMFVLVKTIAAASE